ncbi:MAG: DMT family transporter [Sphaerochaeta sp.]
MKKIQINILAILACLLWASAFAAGKYSLLYLPPITLAGIRLLIAALMLSFFAKKEELKRLLPYWHFLLGYSVLKVAIPFIAFNLGLVRVTGSLGAMIVGSSPAISIIMAVAFIKTEHFNKEKIISMILGMIAIIMLSLSKSSDGTNQILGVIFLLVNCVCGAFGDIYIKKKTDIKFSVSLNFLQVLVGSLFVIAAGFITEGVSLSSVAWNAKVIFDIIYLAFITACATTIWLKLVQEPSVEISVIAIWKLLIPSVGALLSWILTPGDSPTLISVASLMMILVSIFIATRRNASKKLKLKMA